MTGHPPLESAKAPPERIARILAPQGVLRAAANLANTILVQEGASGELDGAALRIAATVAPRN